MTILQMRETTIDVAIMTACGKNETIINSASCVYNMTFIGTCVVALIMLTGPALLLVALYKRYWGGDHLASNRRGVRIVDKYRPRAYYDDTGEDGIHDDGGDGKLVGWVVGRSIQQHRGGTATTHLPH